ncbi:hypothetical protein CGCSCA5_v013520 [Colletotrichum siamense]|nr:hypothetical protein CGCSCA5_v013520 [Colletotrichum siamense]KAF4879993.1 hypothetical protein CGCSCA1_v001359 [Colletotrichum siamense]
MFQWYEFRGIFARSPEEFVDGAKLRRSASDEDACEFSLANRGVRIDTRFRKGQKGIYVMYLGLSELETGADVCLSLVRTADGFVRSHPWSLSSDINKSFPENRVLTAYVRKDVDIEEEWQIRRRRRSIHINISLPPSLHIDYINPHPRQFWDEFFHTFLIPHPEEDFGATVDFGVKEVDSRLNTKYPMRLTLGWSTMSDVFHADIHTMGQPASEQEKGPEYKTPGRRMVPGGLSDGVGKWLSVHARSRPQKVYFVDEDSDSQPQGSRDKTARITTFEISVETCDELDGTEYYVLVTGQVERMDLENDRFRVLLTPGLTERVPYMMNPPAYPDLFQGSAIEVSTTTSLSLSTEEAPTDYVLTTPHIQ